MVHVLTQTSTRLALASSSDLADLDALVDLTDAFVAGLGLDDELAYRVVLLMSEAATNAITHGNREDPSKKVTIVLERSGDQLELTVEDEGEGFDPDAVQNPVAAENLMRDGGRGLFFIREMAREVHLENNGRRIRIIFSM